MSDEPEFKVFVKGFPGERDMEILPTKEGAMELIRRFQSGATRDLDEDKLDYEGFLSPVVLRRFAEYMHEHRKTAAGMRDSDNWQKGIPLDVYMKSLFRHFMDLWLMHRGVHFPDEDAMENTLCAIMFNTMGYLHQWLGEE